MIEHRTGSQLIARSIPFVVPKECAPCVSGTRLPDRTTERGPYAPNELSNPEAAALLGAAVLARQLEADAHAEIDAGMRTVAEREIQASSRIRAVELFVQSGALTEAHRVAREVRELHGQDGPESRRHRPKGMTWLLWLTILLAAVYDTTFLASALLWFLDDSWDWASVTTYIALVPGVLIAVALLVAGNWVAEAICRARAHRERRRTRPRPWWWRRNRPEQVREVTAMPWPLWGLPVGALVVVLGTLGVWAGIRAETAGMRNDDVAIPSWPMVLLVLLFGLAAVGMKVLHHNPYIHRTKEVAHQLAQVVEEGTGLVAEMTDGLARYRHAVADLAARAERVDEQARRLIDQAMVSILRDRDAHGLAGDIAPKFAEPAGGTPPEQAFQEIVEPYLPGLTRERVRRFLAGHEPEKFRARWERALADFQAVDSLTGR